MSRRGTPTQNDISEQAFKKIVLQQAIDFFENKGMETVIERLDYGNGRELIILEGRSNG